jgi:hypothetical protein
MAVYLVLLIYSGFLVHWPQGQKEAFLSFSRLPFLSVGTLFSVKHHLPRRPSWKEWHDQKARNTPRAQVFHAQTRPRVAAGSTKPQEGHQNCPSSRALSINLPTLGAGRPGGNGDIDGHKTINLISRHNKSCSPVVLRFQPAFPPSPAGLYASAGAEDARKRESSQARSRQNCLKSWANKEGRKKTLQFKISCLIDLTHFHSLMLVNTPSFPPI